MDSLVSSVLAAVPQLPTGGISSQGVPEQPRDAKAYPGYTSAEMCTWAGAPNQSAAAAKLGSPAETYYKDLFSGQMNSTGRQTTDPTTIPGYSVANGCMWGSLAAGDGSFVDSSQGSSKSVTTTVVPGGELVMNVHNQGLMLNGPAQTVNSVFDYNAPVPIVDSATPLAAVVEVKNVLQTTR